MGLNLWKEAEKKAKKAVSSIIDPAADEAKRQVYNGSKWARDAVRKVGDEAEGAVNHCKDEAIQGVKRAGQEVEDGLEEKLPELVEDVMRDMAEKASDRSIQQALDTACDVIEFMSPTRYTLIFGIELALVVQGEVTIAATIPNPLAKLTEVRKWAKNPPRGRAQIVACVRDFGPESLAAEFKVSGNGGAVEWSGEDKYQRIDAFLEKHGVE